MKRSLADGVPLSGRMDDRLTSRHPDTARQPSFGPLGGRMDDRLISRHPDTARQPSFVPLGGRMDDRLISRHPDTARQPSFGPLSGPTGPGAGLQLGSAVHPPPGRDKDPST
jgi:hypothetical protein